MATMLLFSEHSELYSTVRLMAEAKNLGLDPHWKNPYEHFTLGYNAAAQLPTGRPLLILHRTTGVRQDDFDLQVSLSLQKEGITVVNDPHAMLFLRQKDWQDHLLKEHQLPTVPTYSFRGHPGPRQQEEILLALGPYLGTKPQFILKSTRGNQGIGVSLLRGMDSLMSVLETLWAIRDQHFLIQPYLQEAVEYRLFICRQKILSALKRTPRKNDFRANNDRGSAEIMDPHHIPMICQQALLGVKAANIFYGAVDILLWREQIFILEINPVPGFKQLEKLTGENIAGNLWQEMMDHYAAHL
jgi:ribosomal protein S6--L-glutamate ligase